MCVDDRSSDHSAVAVIGMLVVIDPSVRQIADVVSPATAHVEVLPGDKVVIDSTRDVVGRLNEDGLPHIRK